MQETRRPILAGNWKLNNYWEDCEQFVTRLRELLPEYFDETSDPPLELVVCPAFPYLGVMGSLLDDARILLGAQNVSMYESGAYTGEVSSGMLANSGCDYCIVGHSERRAVFGETDELLLAKLKLLRAAEIVPILCVGEALEVRESGRATEHVLGQLQAVGPELSQFDPGDLAIAYEPVWAIGTGRNATEQDAQGMMAEIRNWLARQTGPEMASMTQLLYGGSVKPENIAMYMACTDIDGALVGGASLKGESYAEMARACLEKAQRT